MTGHSVDNRSVRKGCAAAFLALVVVLTAGCDGDRGASADVAGLRYSVSGGNDVTIDLARVVPFAPIDRIDYADWLADQTAYAILGIDPKQILVIKIRPEIVGTTNAPQKPYMLLERGSGARKLLCSFTPAVGAKPATDCD